MQIIKIAWADENNSSWIVDKHNMEYCTRLLK